MTPGARIQAAIELLDLIERQPADAVAPPADAVVNSYFRARRYIGSKDRRAVGDAVFQTLRERGAIDWRLAKAGLPAENRFRALWTFHAHHGMSADALLACGDGSAYAPAPPSAAEREGVQRLERARSQAPDTLADRASFPAWLAPEIERQFGAAAEAEMMALALPAPTDLRVNILKATREQAAKTLADAGVPAAPTPLSPLGLRLAGRANLPNLAAFRDGWIEIQDESSQLAALLVGAAPGLRVLDLCAGAGGKTLALAATMHNRGAIVACDTFDRRLARMAPRLERAGAAIVERVCLDAGDKALDRIGLFDRVIVDAPCSSSGTWRRRPDTKWTLTPERLRHYAASQLDVLADGAARVKPGGRLIFCTCSILPSEGRDIVAAFMASAGETLRLLPADAIWRETLAAAAPFAGPFMLLTPRRHGTDGFFLAVMERVR